MSGHSKWSTIKHKKGINDAKRAKIFTKHGKIITIAARDGGNNPENNFQLRLAMERARMDNMPKENIERAIKRGTGELKDQAEIKEVVYEAYGPGQVAMLIKTATDNTNRTLGDVKTILNKTNGKWVPAGSVGFLFKQVGRIEVNAEENNLDELEMKAIESGAEDTIYSENSSIDTIPQEVRTRLEKDVFHAPLEKIWADTRDFFSRRDPTEIEKAEKNPKHLMALIFKWYLGNSAIWAICGDTDHCIDYQICCGPSMGAFNTWVKGSFLEKPENRKVSDIALNLLEGAAVVTRAQQVRSYGVPVPGEAFNFRPRPLSYNFKS